MYEELLEEIGLTQGETKVYLALLELGSSTVGPIVNKSGVAYSNVYNILKRLKQKGLVTSVKKSKTKHFQAVEPYSLKEYLEEKEDKIQAQKERLKTAIPELKQLHKEEERQEAEVFENYKGVRAAYEKLVEEAEKIDFLYFYQEENVNKVDQFYQRIWTLFQDVEMRGITQEEYQERDFMEEIKQSVEMRFVDFPVPSNIDITGDKVLIISWKKPTAILIKSKDTAQQLQEYFDNLWKVADN